jgi:hypothetical protein
MTVTEEFTEIKRIRKRSTDLSETIKLGNYNP